ncbi:GNAT family N-acetyltransferase [Methyloceanibacter stevinii]|nr:GNAT family N-acetyltransferase [Methyloceanibacter stevinii]
MTASAFPPTADLGSAWLCPITDDARRTLAAVLATMAPWSTLAIPEDGLSRFLAGGDEGTRQYAITVDGATAGVVCTRFPWLKGPYVELLAVLPGHQGHGLGTKALTFVEAEAKRAGARNVWVCASEFNGLARRFYERRGFVEVGTLPDLVTDGFAEVLFRKALA